MPTFAQFWAWLCRNKRTVNNLGCRGHSFDIQALGDKGTCTPRSTGRSHPFSKAVALRVWDRFHGAMAASLVYNSDVHLRAGTYAKPNKPPSLNSWPACPSIRCAPWIAAAIAEYLGIHPCGTTPSK